MECFIWQLRQASSIENMYESSETNLLSSLKIIDYCSKLIVPLVYASSSAVYGNLPLGTENENTDILSPYAADKLVLEIYSNLANKLYGLPSFGLRFFNVYGPRQSPSNPYSGVISIFSDRILKGLPITINGGYQTRDFIFVTDVVRGIYASLEYLQSNPVSTFANILTGKSISIDELADKIIDLTGNEVEKLYQKLPNGDPKKSSGSKDWMEEKLNLNSFTQLEEGLKEVLTDENF